MNLEKLFKMQKELDERILDRFPELRNEDLLDKKILALQVELGELAQKWRGFKFWSENQEPRVYESVSCNPCLGSGDENWEASQERVWEGKKPLDYKECESCNGSGDASSKNTLLEEYVDCLHFILSIGNEAALHYCQPVSRFLEYQIEIELNDVTDQFLHLFMEISGTIRLDTYIRIWNLFHGLGKMLGFTWQQIETAYYEKNKVNHERQANGY